MNGVIAWPSETLTVVNDISAGPSESEERSETSRYQRD